MSAVVSAAYARRTRVRLFIVTMLFLVTTVNYADRATLSIAGSEVSRQLGLSKVVMGYAFSAFGWAYVIGQIPGGWLLDRFGSKRVYMWSIITWSIFTFLQGFVGYFEAATAPPVEGKVSCCRPPVAAAARIAGPRGSNASAQMRSERRPVVSTAAQVRPASSLRQIPPWLKALAKTVRPLGWRPRPVMSRRGRPPPRGVQVRPRSADR